MSVYIVILLLFLFITLYAYLCWRLQYNNIIKIAIFNVINNYNNEVYGAFLNFKLLWYHNFLYLLILIFSFDSSTHCQLYLYLPWFVIIILIISVGF